MELNKIYQGDCLDVLKDINNNTIDLIYADPPFFTNRNFGSFEDRWKGGINHYIEWMKERVFELHRVLKDTGSFYLHCDWHASHYLKVMCDDIFGINNFRNEIIWCYSGGGIPKKDFPRKHDVILRYTKSDNYYFKPIYRPYSPGTIQRGRTKVKGKYAEMGLRKEGTPIDDWWIDIPKITSPTDPEKLGYPTQKSEALMERIIKASSDKDDLILDPFCGCGTTIAVAQMLNRKWIGIDVNQDAVNIANKRIAKLTQSLII